MTRARGLLLVLVACGPRGDAPELPRYAAAVTTAALLAPDCAAPCRPRSSPSPSPFRSAGPAGGRISVGDGTERRHVLLSWPSLHSLPTGVRSAGSVSCALPQSWRRAPGRDSGNPPVASLILDREILPPVCPGLAVTSPCWRRSCSPSPLRRAQLFRRTRCDRASWATVAPCSARSSGEDAGGGDVPRHGGLDPGHCRGGTSCLLFGSLTGLPSRRAFQELLRLGTYVIAMVGVDRFKGSATVTVTTWGQVLRLVASASPGPWRTRVSLRRRGVRGDLSERMCGARWRRSARRSRRRSSRSADRPRQPKASRREGRTN